MALSPHVGMETEANGIREHSEAHTNADKAVLSLGRNDQSARRFTERWKMLLWQKWNRREPLRETDVSKTKLLFARNDQTHRSVINTDGADCLIVPGFTMVYCRYHLQRPAVGHVE